jgi:NADPH-dependent F420 reductase
VNVGIIGGTGPAGRGLAARLAACGVDVIVGSRSTERGHEIAAEIRNAWPDRDLPLTGADNAGAASCEIVVVATPWDGAVSTVQPLSGELRGKFVVSMANALTKVGDELQALVPPRGSVAAAVQCALPDSAVAGAFHHLPARDLGRLDREMDADVLVSADDPVAVRRTIELVETIPGLRGVDAGSLSGCAAIEAFTAVLVNVNILHRAHASIRLTGLGDRAIRS